MAEGSKESTSLNSSGGVTNQQQQQHEHEHDVIVEDSVKSPPNSPNSSTRKDSGLGIIGRRLGIDQCRHEVRLCPQSGLPRAGGNENGKNIKKNNYEKAEEDEISSSGNSAQACYAVLQSWVSKKFMTGCVVLFPVAVTFFVTWWIVQFFDGFFSPIYERLGVEIFGLGFLTSLIFIFFVGIFASSWMGATVFWVGEWFIKRMPFVKHIYSASKQISAAISPDQNTTAFKEVAIIRHPRLGEYAFGFITSSVVLQRENGDEELCSVYVPTNHLYIGDVFLVNSEEIIRPNLSIREGIEIIVSVGMSMPQSISPIERVSRANDRVQLNRMM
ncbi:COV 2-like protein [Tanacetum coccineum]|uniref:COV 2-like protein n=1 Tax=Tanacetum coccineum TaxID=301880 RepID=A0ABQ5AX56_9ASTR